MNRQLRKEINAILKQDWSFNNKAFSIATAIFNYKYPMCEISQEKALFNPIEEEIKRYLKEFNSKRILSLLEIWSFLK